MNRRTFLKTFSSALLAIPAIAASGALSKFQPRETLHDVVEDSLFRIDPITYEQWSGSYNACRPLSPENMNGLYKKLYPGKDSF